MYRFGSHEEADEWMIRTIAHRAPELEDLLSLCKALNAEGVRYVLIGT
jgi:DNA repair photolyase